MSKPTCGIVMPISAIDDCDAQHWSDVKEIISDAIREADYDPQLVSSAVEVNIIQKRIIQNLYQNPIVICDVSCKNANVMLELGMRLAFDKPTIVIKDDQTGYSFDTSPIEHLTYPRSLRHGTINKFKEELVVKIKGTMAAKEKDPEFSPFLKAFGPIKAVSMETKEVPAQELIFDMLQSMNNKIEKLGLQEERSRRGTSHVNALGALSISATNIFYTSKLGALQRALVMNVIHGMDSKLETSYEEDNDRGVLKVRGRDLTPDKIEAISSFLTEVTRQPTQTD